MSQLTYEATYAAYHPITVYANSEIDAQQHAGILWNLKPAQWHRISVRRVLTSADIERIGAAATKNGSAINRNPRRG